VATDNLNIHKQLNALLRQRTQTLSVHGDMLRDQVALAGSMQTALEGANPEEVADRYTEVREALDEVAESAKKTGDSMERGMNQGNKAAGKTNSIFSKLVTAMKTVIVFPFKIGWAIAKFIGGVAAKSTILLWNAFKGVLNVMTQVVSSAANIGKSLAVYVLDVIQNLIDLSDTMAKKWLEIRKIMEKSIRAPFGDYAEDVAKSMKSATSSMTNQTSVQKEYGLNMYAVFADVGDATQWLSGYFEKLGAVGSLLGKDIAAMGMDFVLAAKGMGINEDQMKSLSEYAVATGEPIKDVLGDMANMSLQMSEAFGFSGKLVSKDMATMRADVSHFGNLTTKRLSEIAIRARTLVVDIEGLGSVIDKHLSFDDAAESAAKAAQAFGINIDAIELMQEASKGGVGVIDAYRKALFEAGKSADEFSLVELKLLEQSTGLNEGQARLAFSMKYRNKTMEEITKTSEYASKKELTQAESTQKLADATERYIRFIEMSDGMFERFFQGFGRGILMNNKFLESMFNIRRVSELVESAGRKVGQMFIELFKPASMFLDALDSMYDVEKYTALTDTINTAFELLFTGLGDVNAEDVWGNFFETIKTGFVEYFTFEKEIRDAKGKLLETVPTTFKDVLMEALTETANSVPEGIQYLFGKIKEVLTNSTKLLRGEITFSEIFPMFANTDKNADTLLTKLRETFDVVWVALKAELMSEEFHTILKDFLVSLAEKFDSLIKGDKSGEKTMSSALFESLLGVLWSGVKLLDRALKPVWNFLWDDVIKKGWNWVLETKLKPWLSEKIDWLKEWAYDKFLGAVKGIGYAMKKGFQFSLLLIAAPILAVTKPIEIMIDVIKRIFQGDSLGDIIGDYFTSALAKFEAFSNSTAVSVFLDTVGALWEGMMGPDAVDATTALADAAEKEDNGVEGTPQSPDVGTGATAAIQDSGMAADAIVVATPNATANGLSLDDEALVDLGPLNLHLRLQVNLDANRVANVLIKETRVVGREA
jgi:hypothetical protein